MPDTQDTIKTQGTQAPKERKGAPLQVVGGTQHEYKVDVIMDFIDRVFEDTVPEGAHRLFYAPRSASFAPGMPIQEGIEHLERIMTRTTKGRPLYFNTASVYPTAEGELRHKKSQFAALHVVVLDDIGTKIDPDTIPKELKPTYIVETSKGNHQYGYVLEDAITNHDHAAALVQVLGLSGLTDTGGVMATKLVRLPGGINGKRDPEKHGFEVNLVEFNDVLWTPDALLEALNYELDGVKVTWDKVLHDDTLPLARRHNTQYMPLQPQAQSLDGVIDPVLEWLYANDMVLGDSGGEWVDIRCPQSHLHTTGDDSAGYTPVGRGVNTRMRAFHCFHEHCQDYGTQDFIHYVLVNSDLHSIPQYDPSGPLFSNYVFDGVNNRVWCCREGTTQAFNIDGFRTQFNERTTAYCIGSGGKLTHRTLTAAGLWLESPYRTVVHGAVHDPAGAGIVEDSMGALWVNTYRPVPWGDGNYDEEMIKPFIQHLRYLLPDEKEHDYFMDWLTAKVHDPCFRGTGIVMVAEAFGVGRSTLGNMLAELFGTYNSEIIPFDTLVNPQTYNYWEDKQFVIVPESKETARAQDTKGAYRAYEALKLRVDTTVTETSLNLKYQPHKHVKVTCSYLILTNHHNAIAVPEDDRRLTIMRNPDKPASTEYFDKLYEWLGKKDRTHRPVWARHVYRWLRQRKIADPARLMLPLRTEAKRVMAYENTGGVGRILRMMERSMLDDRMYFATTPQLKKVLMDVLIGINDPRAAEYTETYIRHCLDDITLAFSEWQVKPGPGVRSQRVRVLKKAVTSDLLPGLPDTGVRYMKTSKLPRGLQDSGKRSVERFEKTNFAQELIETLQADQ